MFEQLFGSKTRVKLMRVFLDNPEKRYFVRELTRETDCLINSVRRELDNLINLKLINVQERRGKDGDKKAQNVKKYYHLNQKNLFQQDLINLFAKGKILLEKKLIEKIKRLGDVIYISFGGTFIDDAKATTDLLIIGELDKQKASASMKKFEKEMGRSIRYTILEEEEYILRRDIADRFLLDIIENENNIVVVDRLSRKLKSNLNTEIVQL
ncbi:hypothetical protein HQ571_00930 [Candidatus Kuenenbacteria bacterium]|nr:hypothetical protein [Candidatus Kuenenbacteria bacterium]